ncbi:hypothetical protein B8V81_1004 [Paenibacillus pasadenensis]|uniref:Uncharacterized protein n=1 Tax=Paenibacillus pasadenensis TaxID=217090 RepID=A0A2N5N906_9BACL|nr:hypothetical protein B8V81_1004 [Paenibacillus pasadenensis]
MGDRRDLHDDEIPFVHLPTPWSRLVVRNPFARKDTLKRFHSQLEPRGLRRGPARGKRRKASTYAAAAAGCRGGGLRSRSGSPERRSAFDRSDQDAFVEVLLQERVDDQHRQGGKPRLFIKDRIVYWNNRLYALTVVGEEVKNRRVPRGISPRL